jgi:hypothetical protein
MENTTNKCTLEFLTNPLYSKKNTGAYIEPIITKDDRSFYRKRIVSITKDMLKGEYVCANLEKIHNDYIKSLIHHFKTTDEFEILQSEYTISQSKTNVDVSGQTHDLSMQLHDLSGQVQQQQQINAVMMKHTNKRVSLDNFVMKKAIHIKQLIPAPKRKEINVNTPAHKVKGIKPKQLKE